MDQRSDHHILSSIDDALAGGSWYPRLPGPLTKPYLVERDAARRPYNRIAAIVGIISYDICYLPSRVYTPDAAPLVALLFFAVFTPFAVTLLIYDWRRKTYWPAYHHWLFVICAVAYVIADIVALATSNPADLPMIRLYPTMLISSGFIMRMAPHHAIANALFAAFCFIGAVVTSPLVPRGFELSSLVMVESLIAAYAIFFAYQWEGHDRRVFLLRTADSIRRAELAAQNRGLLQLAQTDMLTGLANRRYFEDQLGQIWHSALLSNDPVALIMIDIDHFKKFNDSAGHPAGDRCLRQVASAANAQMRENDLIARYGGEEFVVLMPQATLEIAMMVAQRLRDAIEALQLPHPGIEPDGHVTISLGVAATYPAAGTVAGDLIHEADQGLYQAKRHGRNCAYIADHSGRRTAFELLHAQIAQVDDVAAQGRATIDAAPTPPSG